MCCGGGGYTIDPAEMRRQTETQERLALEYLNRADDQFDYFKTRQEDIDAIAKDVTERQLTMAEELHAQGKDLYEYQRDVFRPVEQSLVDQAMRESTPEYYERYAQEAMAQQAAAQANAQGQMERTMASMGVNPNSGAYMAQQRGLQLGNAAMTGAAVNDARDRAEALGWARRADVAGLGKGLVGAGNASYGLATGANQAASGATNAANQQAQAGMGTATQYGQIGMQSISNLTNTYADIYKADTARMGQESAALGSGLGTIAGIAGAAAFGV